MFAAPSLSFAAAADPPPPGSIPAEVSDLAKQIVKFLDGMGELGLEVGQIVPVGNSKANGGPGLRAELIQSLETHRKGVVQDRAKMALNGKFASVSDPADKGADKSEQLLAVRVTIEILDKTSGSTLLGADTFIRRLRDIARIEGATVKLDDAGTREQNNDLKEKIENPRAFINGSFIRATAKSPYEVEIAARPLGAPKAMPRIAHDEEGMPFVDVQKNELYEVIVHNHADHEIAVGITIDGIDMFTFSDDLNIETGRPAFSNWIVQPGRTLVVPGWYKTANPRRGDNYLSFMVMEYGKGASSKIAGASPGALGVITVSIAKSHLKGTAAAKGNAETGFGPPRKGNLRPVERLVDPPHEFISVRYTR